MARRFGRILVPLDGTPAAEMILDEVSALAALTQGEVLLLHVVRPHYRPVLAAEAPERPPTFGAPPVIPGYAVPTGVIGEEYSAAEISAAQQYLERVAARLGQQGLRVRTLLRAGPDVPQVIAETAEQEEADLIALAVETVSPLARLLFGSVPLEVLQRTARPLLIRRVASVGGSGAPD